MTCMEQLTDLGLPNGRALPVLTRVRAACDCERRNGLVSVSVRRRILVYSARTWFRIQAAVASLRWISNRL